MPTVAAWGVAALGAHGAREDRESAEEISDTSKRQRSESQQFIEDQVEQARGDLFKLFPQAQESRRLGAQAGLDLFGEVIPQQLEAFQGGNVAAQQQLIQGLPQFQNAILGQPTNLNFQPTQLGAEFNVPQLPAGVPFNATS